VIPVPLMRHLLATFLLPGFLLSGSSVLAQAPSNDLFANRMALFGATNIFQASNVGAFNEPGEPRHAGTDSTRSVWWTWTAPITGSFALSTAGSTFDTLVAVYTGSGFSNLIEVVSDDDSGGNSTSRAVFRAIAGETYQIAVAGFLGAEGTIFFSLTPCGYPAPSWTLAALTGYPVSSTGFPHKVLMLDFFETTCGDCIIETPDLVAYRRAREARGFQVLGIAKDRLPLAQVRDNVSVMGIDYPVLINTSDVEARFDGPLAMPTKVIVDREGKIQMQIVGGRTFSEFAALIDPLLRVDTHLQLKSQRQADRLLLSWPASEYGYVVESSPDMTGPSWSQVLAPVFENPNGDNVVNVPAGPVATFFRLRKM